MHEKIGFTASTFKELIREFLKNKSTSHQSGILRNARREGNQAVPHSIVVESTRLWIQAVVE